MELLTISAKVAEALDGLSLREINQVINSAMEAKGLTIGPAAPKGAVLAKPQPPAKQVKPPKPPKVASDKEVARVERQNSPLPKELRESDAYKNAERRLDNAKAALAKAKNSAGSQLDTNHPAYLERTQALAELFKLKSQFRTEAASSSASKTS